MRFPLACLLVVVTACSGRPAPTAPTAGSSIALYAGSREVVVPFAGRRGDALPSWIPVEVHRQFAGD